jgi:hypothetical protein
LNPGLLRDSKNRNKFQDIHQRTRSITKGLAIKPFVVLYVLGVKIVGSSTHGSDG